MNHTALNDDALDQLFRTARTAHGFKPEPLPEGTLRRLFELAQWGPTAFNAQPARFIFVHTPAGKEKLLHCVSQGNVEQTRSAPLTVVVGYDLRFYDLLPQVGGSADARKHYESKPEVVEAFGLRNSTLQGAYLILAARALGLDAGPMGGFNAHAVNAAFFPEGRCKANFLINVGVADPAFIKPRAPRFSMEQAVILA
jgi:3-hydroxypropanoate dehydrogenase